MQHENDRDLVQRILRGDEAAFGSLVESYQARVFRLVRGIVGDWHHSEDVCQEIFTVVFRKLASFRHRSSLSTWIYRVAVNAALKARRRYRRLEGEPVETLGTFPSPPDPRVEDLEGDEVFRKLLAPLPPRLRLPVVLRDQLGLNYTEISAILRCSRGAVEQRLHRAMVALREIWKEGERLPR